MLKRNPALPPRLKNVKQYKTRCVKMSLTQFVHKLWTGLAVKFWKMNVTMWRKPSAGWWWWRNVGGWSRRFVVEAESLHEDICLHQDSLAGRAGEVRKIQSNNCWSHSRILSASYWSHLENFSTTRHILIDSQDVSGYRRNGVRSDQKNGVNQSQSRNVIR